MKRSIFILGLILISTISALSFIYFSNDHIECETVVNNTSDSNGNIIKTEEHNCKEKYNFWYKISDKHSEKLWLS